MIAPAFFSRLTLKRDADAIGPLIDVLAPRDRGQSMATTHKLMWTLMPDEIRRHFDDAVIQRARTSPFLWREAKPGVFYLLGPEPVRQSPFFHVEAKPYAPELATGDRLAFDLRVHATVDRTIARDAAGRAIRARTDIAMDRMKTQEAEAPADGLAARAERRERAAAEAAEQWLGAQGERHGFALRMIDLVAYRVERLPRRREIARIGVFDLRGVVEVTAPDAFLPRVLAGFGRAKAFGCGLMLLRRAP